MSFIHNNVFKKITSCFVSFFLVLIVFLSLPTKTFAGIVWDPGNNIPNVASAFADSGIMIKEYGLDTAAFLAINGIIKKITAQTVNWINSGFKGNPAYVQNPRQFFLGIADDQVSNFLSETNLSQLCTPFKANVRIALVKNYLSETNNKVYSCTLSRIANNYDGFMQDFSQGGWDSWYEVTQNDQNNPYGSYLDAQSKLNVEIGSKQTKYQKQLDWGKGVLSFERCKEENIITQEDVDAGYAEEGYAVGDCYDDGTGDNMETVTPGGVIETQLNKVLGTGVSRIEVGDEINEIINALLSQLTNRIVGGIGAGLRGTTEQTNGQSAFMSRLQEEVENPDRDVSKYITCDGGGNCEAVKQPESQSPNTGSLQQEALDRLCSQAPGLCDGGSGGNNGGTPTYPSYPTCVVDEYGNCI